MSRWLVRFFNWQTISVYQFKLLTEDHGDEFVEHLGYRMVEMLNVKL